LGRRATEELSIPFDKKYGAGKMDLLKANFSREYLLMKRNSFVYIFRISQVIIDSHYRIEGFCFFFFCMTLFTDLLSANNSGIDFHATLLSDQDALRHGIIYTGALFFTATTIMFDGIAELPTTKTKLPVFSRQRELFFPALTYSIPPCMLKIPIKIDCFMVVPNLL
jgi:hypothetical protein